MHRTERGFALPLTIFLIALITLMLTAAFTKVTADRRIADSSGAAANALALARSGVQQYMGTRPFASPGSPTAPWRPPDGDSIRINVTGGYADVVATVIRQPADTLANWLYLIRATGYVLDPTLGADPQAVRTIAQFAHWQTGSMDVRAAYTAANQLTRVAGTGTSEVWVYGSDYAGIKPAVPAVRVPTGGDLLPSTWGTTSNGTKWHVVGTQPQADGKATVALLTHIDWQAIESGLFTPDYKTAQHLNFQYPSQMLTGSATLTDVYGSGLLIVTGDLTLAGSYVYWNGIILVGGRIRFTANDQRIYGMAVTGLDEGNGTGPVLRTDIGNRTTHIYYHSDHIRLTLARLSGFAPMANAWVDNWATY